jgi:hypothetical protein
MLGEKELVGGLSTTDALKRLLREEAEFRFRVPDDTSSRFISSLRDGAV